MTDTPRLDPTIKLGNDFFGVTLFVWLLSRQSVAARRIGVYLIILSGVDGIAKVALAETTGAQQAYQVPWIALGIAACRWIVTPPRLGR